MRINIYTVKLVKESGVNYSLESSICSSETASKLIDGVLDLSSCAVEKFGFVALNTKNKIVGIHVITIGGINQAFVEPREIFQQAILNNAVSIILFHNHPSGDPEPSKADIELTRKLEEAGKLLGIRVLDHIIIGENSRHTSLKSIDMF
jgi:DNA repair protein RadC